MNNRVRACQGQYSVASVWHTCCALAMLASFSVLLAYLSVGSTRPRLGHVLLYSIVVIFEWIVFAFSLWKSNAAFVAYVARVFQDPRSLMVDTLVAVLLSAVSFWLHPSSFVFWGKLDGFR
jgi:hypothetical protein